MIRVTRLAINFGVGSARRLRVIPVIRRDPRRLRMVARRMRAAGWAPGRISTVLRVKAHRVPALLSDRWWAE